MYVLYEWRISTVVSLLTSTGVYLLCSSMLSGIDASSASSLSSVKKHLLVYLLEYVISGEIVRNATGHRIGVKGVSPLLLDWICQRYDYKYEYVDLNNTRTFEDSGTKSRGVMYYASRGQVDVIMAISARVQHRLKYLDFAQPWLYTPTECLIPVPGTPNSVYAVLKPFSFGVWMLLIFTAIAITILLLVFNYLFFNRNQRHSFFQKEYHLAIRGAYVYVLGTLLNQGGYLANRTAAVRSLTGAWCLLSLVLLNLYNGTLVSYMTAAPRAVPLISHIEDVIPNPNLHLVVDKGLGVDVSYSAADKGVNKQLGDKLNNYSKSRCNVTQQCIDLVKSKPHQHIYVSTRVTLLSVIQEDFIKTKECSLTITGKVSGIPIYGWALAKNSPYLENVNRGTLNAIETGLVDKWQKLFQPNARPCYEEKPATNSKKKRRTKKTLDRLTLGNLAGAFALLGFGSLVSIVSFVLEVIYSRFLQLKRNNFEAK